MKYLCVFYLIGTAVAFVLSIIHVILAEKNNENIDEAPAMVPTVSIFSWLYVYMFIKTYLPKYIK